MIYDVAILKGVNRDTAYSRLTATLAVSLLGRTYSSQLFLLQKLKLLFPNFAWDPNMVNIIIEIVGKAYRRRPSSFSYIILDLIERSDVK